MKATARKIHLVDKNNPSSKATKQVVWDDEAPYRFVKYFGEKHKRTHKKLKKNCVELCKERRLIYKEVHINKIKRKNYTIFTFRLRHHAKRYNEGKVFGTFFCRPRDDGRWQLKDGSHRYLTLVVNGHNRVRIAFDPENKV
jgi:hypothetical protein